MACPPSRLSARLSTIGSTRQIKAARDGLTEQQIDRPRTRDLKRSSTALNVTCSPNQVAKLRPVGGRAERDLLTEQVELRDEAIRPRRAATCSPSNRIAQRDQRSQRRPPERDLLTEQVAQRGDDLNAAAPNGTCSPTRSSNATTISRPPAPNKDLLTEQIEQRDDDLEEARAARDLLADQRGGGSNNGTTS